MRFTHLPALFASSVSSVLSTSSLTKRVVYWAIGIAIFCVAWILQPLEWHNDYDVEALTRQWVYPFEAHTVRTSDGYLLEVHRIRHGRSGPVAAHAARPPVLLQHGFATDSTNFVANLPNQSLAFMLADAGFDVWLGNSRGNSYGRLHETLHQWEDMATKDIPAIIDKVLEITGEQRLNYIGHSQGALIIFARLSEDEELTRKIQNLFAMAPALSVTKVRGLIAGIVQRLIDRQNAINNEKVIEALEKLPKFNLKTQDFGSFVDEFNNAQAVLNAKLEYLRVSSRMRSGLYGQIPEELKRNDDWDGYIKALFDVLHTQAEIRIARRVLTRMEQGNEESVRSFRNRIDNAAGFAYPQSKEERITPSMDAFIFGLRRAMYKCLCLSYVLAMYKWEDQRKYFAKREYVQHSIVHVLHTNKQDNHSVVQMIDHVLSILCEMNITGTHFRADNAGAYHSLGTIASIPHLAKKNGVAIHSFSFSEAQNGKSSCDRVAAQNIKKFTGQRVFTISQSHLDTVVRRAGTKCAFFQEIRYPGEYSDGSPLAPLLQLIERCIGGPFGSRIDVYMSSYPDGMSTKNVVHFSQMVRNKRTAHFDYGAEENLERYGSPIAPAYNFTNVKVPMYLWYSPDDYLVSDVDMDEYILPSLNTEYLKLNISLPLYNHVDFHWGLRAVEDIYKPIIEILTSETKFE
ncbi:hypothetical protein PRIPAC_77937 [Pristionchus pacificus]|uniref:Hydrolase n=1 Tax=Pristionchus pacificus TaxID=54126 RepID=A0A2A6CQP5_PRIPA|nr:hypothetical protein PRIPAC_77937 [Pristionchus pacificus]|eukprot:PDM80408.1 hydrolase [Pristionchus pacificus]